MVLSIVMLLGIIPVQALAAATIDAGGDDRPTRGFGQYSGNSPRLGAGGGAWDRTYARPLRWAGCRSSH